MSHFNVLIHNLNTAETRILLVDLGALLSSITKEKPDPHLTYIIESFNESWSNNMNYHISSKLSELKFAISLASQEPEKGFHKTNVSRNSVNR